MALSIFENKEIIPDAKQLKNVLGKTYDNWVEIKAFVLSQYPKALEEWNYSGKNYGWGFRLKDKKRVIIYLTPCNNFFLFSFVYGEKATQAALKSNISKEIKQMIESAKVYAEGRGVRLEIHNNDSISDIKELIKIKLEH